jgi:hypothetical protein
MHFQMANRSYSEPMSFKQLEGDLRLLPFSPFCLLLRTLGAQQRPCCLLSVWLSQGASGRLDEHAGGK